MICNCPGSSNNFRMKPMKISYTPWFKFLHDTNCYNFIYLRRTSIHFFKGELRIYFSMHHLNEHVISPTLRISGNKHLSSLKLLLYILLITDNLRFAQEFMII